MKNQKTLFPGNLMLELKGHPAQIKQLHLKSGILDHAIYKILTACTIILETKDWNKMHDCTWTLLDPDHDFQLDLLLDFQDHPVKCGHTGALCEITVETQGFQMNPHLHPPWKRHDGLFIPRWQSHMDPVLGNVNSSWSCWGHSTPSAYSVLTHLNAG